MPLSLIQAFNPDRIKGYHAHVYYADPVEREVAAAIREVAMVSYDVVMGRWRELMGWGHALCFCCCI